MAPTTLHLFCIRVKYMFKMKSKTTYDYMLKAADLQMLNKKKIMVNTGQVMLSGEIYYY